MITDQAVLTRSSRARLLVSRVLRQELYTTDTPVFNVMIITTFPDGDDWTVVLQTDIPDGMLYTVTWPSGSDEPSPVQVYQNVDLKDIKPHD